MPSPFLHFDTVRMLHFFLQIFVESGGNRTLEKSRVVESEFDLFKSLSQCSVLLAINHSKLV